MQDAAEGNADRATAGRRKSAAHAQAEAEHAPLTKLTSAFAAYTEAMATRVAAEEAAEKAAAAEDAAEAALQAELSKLLPAQEAGPPGVVKR